MSTVAMEGMGFLDALNSAPVPGIKIKKKKSITGTTANTKAVSPTSHKVETSQPNNTGFQEYILYTTTLL